MDKGTRMEKWIKVVMVGHPTALDNVGRDGLYVESVQEYREPPISPVASYVPDNSHMHDEPAIKHFQSEHNYAWDEPAIRHFKDY